MTHPNSFYRLNGISLRSVQTKKWSRENTFIIPGTQLAPSPQDYTRLPGQASGSIKC